MLCLGRSLKQLNNAYEREINRMMQEYDLTNAQMEIMRIVEHARRADNAVNQKYLEDVLALKNPTVTGTLNRLEQKGFIRRVADPNDRRSKLIELTDKAEMFHTVVIATIRATEDRVFTNFTEEEKETLARLLNKARDNMQSGMEVEHVQTAD